MNELVEKIIKNQYTKITRERFDTISRHAESINSLEGDVIECGIWKGGMGMYLSKLFPNKQLWLADSFSGFQDHLEDAVYEYKKDRHHKGRMAASFNTVIQNFQNLNINTENIKWLKGYVKDTLPDAGIEKIALLRVDVDAYSATREVLDYLYDKVVSGGYIIFDDTCLFESTNAIKHFFEENYPESEIDLRHPVTDEYIDIYSKSTHPCGSYIIKQ